MEKLYLKSMKTGYGLTEMKLERGLRVKKKTQKTMQAKYFVQLLIIVTG